MSGSRWGLKGQEDLGGGLKAIFQLENGFDVGTGQLGQGGREFGRQAFVGVTGNSWGTVTLGRQYDPSVDMVQGITADNYFGSIVATPGDVDNYDNTLRVIERRQVRFAELRWLPGRRHVRLQQRGRHDGPRPDVGRAQQRTTTARSALAASYLYANNPIRSRPTPAGDAAGTARRRIRCSTARSTSATRRRTRSVSLALPANTQSAR